ncbi:MAG TPA: hypothetical protein DEQ30_15360 [Porphyromonadaceae bacterium]|nr:hypothetical protein [Porphyromonadaceae bacterium]
MKRLFTICVMIIAGYSVSLATSAGVRMSVKTSEKHRVEKEKDLLAGKIQVEKACVEKEVRLSVGKMRAEMARAREELRASAEKARAANMRLREELRSSVGKEKSNRDNKWYAFAMHVAEAAASPEHKREIKKEFPAGSSASLSINNEFGNIQILEGTDNQIAFKITITGKGKSSEDAKKFAESVDVKFTHKGNDITANTVFEKIRCNNCGRSVDYEVYVPKGTELTLDNQFGDIKINNTAKPFRAKLQFGKLYANEVADADLTIQHGGATINKCKSMKLESSFSKCKFGEVEALSGSISHGGIDMDELGNGDLKSDFSNLDIGKLKKSLNTNHFSYGTLKVANVDDRFSTIKVNASFSKVQVAFTKSHNFKATLYTNFGSIKTGDVVFYEKTLDKKDVVVGTAGSKKDPSATVDISNSYGNIVLQ